MHQAEGGGVIASNQGMVKVNFINYILTHNAIKHSTHPLVTGTMFYSDDSGEA